MDSFVGRLDGARGDFYDYHDRDGLGRVYEVHRRSIHPAMRVCKEWGSLLLNEDVKVVCDDQEATDWIGEFFSATNFMAQAQDTVVRAFGLGTGAWELWVDLDRKKVRVRHYDARMVIPLTWDVDGITECAFVTCAFYRGKAVDQLQMHLRGGMGFSAGAFPTFGIIKPAVTNTRVNMSPYGQSLPEPRKRRKQETGARGLRPSPDNVSGLAWLRWAIWGGR